MIVKNEEDVLARCLNCIKGIVDEIIIVDTGSSDRTKKIAQQFTTKIFDFEWCDDFAAARNFSFSKASMEYCMWLDADDVIDEINCQKLMTLKETIDPDIDMVFMKYDVAFDNQGNPTMSYYRERLFKTAKHYQWIGAVHEVIPQFGKVRHEQISILHKKMHPNPPQRNLKIFEKLIADGKKLEPRQVFYYARELYYNEYYDKASVQYVKFLQDGEGWVENNISACKDLAACFYHAQQDDKALQTLFKSFAYDIPRAEICCDIGKHFFDREIYDLAIFWYQLATIREKKEQSGGFCLPDCYDYIPFIQLCVCYDRIGNREKAIYYNEKAGEIKKNDKCYLYNKKYFLSTNS